MRNLLQLGSKKQKLWRNYCFKTFSHIVYTITSVPISYYKFVHTAYHFKAILIGVERQAVKRSAGSSGFIGSSWVAPQAANCIQFFTLDGTVDELLNLWLPLRVGVDCK